MTGGATRRIATATAAANGGPDTVPRRRLQADVVIVGSGIAGLTFGLELADGASVLLVTKKERAASSTNYARGGIAAVMGDDDEVRLHVEDTLVAGAGLCHAGVVELVVREGPARVRDLVSWGARFQRTGEALSLGREGGHSRRRIVHAGDRTGRAIESALLSAAADRGLRILEDHVAVDLLVDEPAGREPRCVGVEVLDEATGARIDVHARLVLLATGGCGRIYRHTTNPAIATGDGIAMAHRAGAVIANMEFIQFHPTALFPTEDPAFLISEALRGEGALLRTIRGRRFMDRHHPLGSLAPRDVVARAIHRELVESGDPHVVLDVAALGERVLRERFPAALDGCRRRGIEPLERGIPVVPAAHYVCGGIVTDTEGRSTLPGLLAAGEVACTGLHGANRLASNSLLEAVVVAHRSAAAARMCLEAEGCWGTAAGRGGRSSTQEPDPRSGMDAEPSGRSIDAGGASVPTAPGTGRVPSPGYGGGAPGETVTALRDLMWTHAGIVRTTARLGEARERLTTLLDPVASAAASDPAVLEARNLAETALLVVCSAEARRESRGLHFTLDHPWRDNERFLRDTVLERSKRA